MEITQFTGEEWTSRLKEAGVAISMDGKGRWIGACQKFCV